MTRPNFHNPTKQDGPLKWHGGKSYLARWIIDQMPDHDVYCEPFCGGAQVFFHKAASPRPSLLNDLDWGLMNFLRLLRKHPDSLADRLWTLRYKEETFDQACQCWERLNTARGRTYAMEQAIYFLIRNRMSRGGLGKTFAWSERLRNNRPGDENAWLSTLERMPALSAHLQGARLLNHPASKIIDQAAWRYPKKRILFYLDPPYLHVTRSATDAYGCEMSDEAHSQLATQLRTLPHPVILSGYPSEEYEKWYGDWRCARKGVPNHAGQNDTKQRRTECLWMNYDEQGELL